MQHQWNSARLNGKFRGFARIGLFMLFLLLVSVVVIPLSAQEAPPEISVTDINRTTELAWFQYVRNGRHPELTMILFDAPVMGYSPFNPVGAEASLEQLIADEAALQTALNLTFSEWLVIAEDDLVGFYGFQTGEFTLSVSAAE